MADIRYKWNDGLNSVQVSGDVSLPQFKVLGHRQKTIEASLSTGTPSSSLRRAQHFWLFRQLLPSGLWDPVCEVNGILPHPDLHSLLADCHHLLGLLLAQQRSHPSTSGTGGDDCPHHDHPHLLHQLSASQDLVRQVYRRVSGRLLLYGLRLLAGWVFLLLMLPTAPPGNLNLDSLIKKFWLTVSSYK